MTSKQWILLDNIKHGWKYNTNLRKDDANTLYFWALTNGYIKDGKITVKGIKELELVTPNDLMEY
jgi:hypothetical protein